MELHELGAQYLKRADILVERIHELNALADRLSGDEKATLKRRISSLYAEAAECRTCATILINYRRKDERFEQK